MKKFLMSYTPLIILGVVFAIWNIIVLVSVPELKTAGLYFWSGYGFMAAAFLLIGGSMFALKVKKEIHFGVVFPAYLAVAIYFVLCLVMNSVLMGLHHYGMVKNPTGIGNLYIDDPTKSCNVAGAIVPNVLLLLVFVIMFLIAYRGILHIGENSKIVNQKVASLKLTVVELNQILALAEDAEVQTALGSLKSDVEYSDPMGTSDTALLEEDLKKKIAEIRMLIEEQYETELILKKIAAAHNKLRERNETLKALK